jgi:hypothetical protein
MGPAVDPLHLDAPELAKAVVVSCVKRNAGKPAMNELHAVPRRTRRRARWRALCEANGLQFMLWECPAWRIDASEELPRQTAPMASGPIARAWPSACAVTSRLRSWTECDTGRQSTAPAHPGKILVGKS